MAIPQYTNMDKVNKELMKYLCIPEDENLITNIKVEISPSHYPLITITQLLVVDGSHYTSDVEFELRAKE